MEMFTLSWEDLETRDDQVKREVLAALVREGLLEREKADEWTATHTVITRKKGIFRTIMDRFLKAEEEKNHWHFLVVEKK